MSIRIRIIGLVFFWLLCAGTVQAEICAVDPTSVPIKILQQGDAVALNTHDRDGVPVGQAALMQSGFALNVHCPACAEDADMALLIRVLPLTDFTVITDALDSQEDDIPLWGPYGALFSWGYGMAVQPDQTTSLSYWADDTRPYNIRLPQNIELTDQGELIVTVDNLHEITREGADTVFTDRIAELDGVLLAIAFEHQGADQDCSAFSVLELIFPVHEQS